MLVIFQEMGIGLEVSDDESESDDDQEEEKTNKMTEQELEDLRKEVKSVILFFNYRFIIELYMLICCMKYFRWTSQYRMMNAQYINSQ